MSETVITAPPSKSMLIRYILISALSDKTTVIEASSLCDDVKAAISCANAIGAGVSYCDGIITIKPCVHFAEYRTFDTGESATVLRLLIGIMASLGGSSVFKLGDSLSKRSSRELLDLLCSRGIKFVEFCNRYEMSGRLMPGVFKLSGGHSSQYTSALLISLPLLNGTSNIVIQNSQVSAPYVEMTIAVLDQFGISIDKTEYGYSVIGSRKYKSPGKICTEGDWSAAAFLFAASKNKSVNVAGLNIKSAQGDKCIFDILKSMGAEISVKNNIVSAKTDNLKGIDIDFQNIPDLVPPVFSAAICACGITRMHGIERLREKECDRVSAILRLSQLLGIKTEYSADTLIVYGNNTNGDDYQQKKHSDFTPCFIYDCENDHRMAMCAAVCAENLNRNVEIIGKHCVSKSYPEFFQNLH